MLDASAVVGQTSPLPIRSVEAHVKGLRALEHELGQAIMALEQATAQVRALQARRVRLTEARGAMLGLLGLDANQFYRWEPAEIPGTLRPVVRTQAEIETTLRERQAALRGAQGQGQPMVPLPPPDQPAAA